MIGDALSRRLGRMDGLRRIGWLCGRAPRREAWLGVSAHDLDLRCRDPIHDHLQDPLCDFETAGICMRSAREGRSLQRQLPSMHSRGLSRSIYFALLVVAQADLSFKA